MDKISRRNFIKLTGGAATAAGLGVTGLVATATSGCKPATEATSTSKTTNTATPTHPKLDTAALLPRPKGQRTVVVGGGWSGLTLAKYIKKASPDMDVVLVS